MQFVFIFILFVTICILTWIMTANSITMSLSCESYTLIKFDNVYYECFEIDDEFRIIINMCHA